MNVINDTLIKYVDIDLQAFKVKNSPLSISDEERRLLNITLKVS